MVVLTVAVVLLVGCDPTPTPIVTPPRADTTVVSVYDGDTIVVEGPQGRLEVRLDGVNAPESGECYHRQATAHLVAILDGRSVGLEVTGTDQFGRALAGVHAGDIDVNLDLVSRGLAIATTPGPGGSETLVEAERDAAGAGLGLWSAESCGTGPIPRIGIDFERSVVDPPGADDLVLDQETVVLVNQGDTEVDLAGWILRDESSRHRYRFADGTRLAPGKLLTVTSTDAGWIPGGSPVWNNGGDLILVLDESGRVVARVRY